MGLFSVPRPNKLGRSRFKPDDSNRKSAVRIRIQAHAGRIAGGTVGAKTVGPHEYGKRLHFSEADFSEATAVYSRPRADRDA